MKIRGVKRKDPSDFAFVDQFLGSQHGGEISIVENDLMNTCTFLSKLRDLFGLCSGDAKRFFAINMLAGQQCFF